MTIPFFRTSTRRPGAAIQSRRAMVAAVLSMAAATMIITTQRSEAACHHYTRWNYPWAQRCALVSIRYRTAASLLQIVKIRAKPVAAPTRVLETSREQIAIPVPSLEFAPCQEGSERLVGIAKLREFWSTN